jgi:hypothetical protein
MAFFTKDFDFKMGFVFSLIIFYAVVKYTKKEFNFIEKQSFEQIFMHGFEQGFMHGFEQ